MLIAAFVGTGSSFLAFATIGGIAGVDPRKTLLSALIGLLQSTPEAWFSAGSSDDESAEIEALIEQRNQARAERDFQKADAIRDELIDLKEDVSIRLNMKYFAYHYGLTMTNQRFAKLFGHPRREPESEMEAFHWDMAASVQKVTEESVYQRLLVSRPIFPLGKDLGYLPGDIEEKLNPWMQPIFDNIELLLGAVEEGSKRKRGYKELVDLGLLEIEALTYIRGRSIPKQYMIVDEAQNLTKNVLEQLRLLSNLETNKEKLLQMVLLLRLVLVLLLVLVVLLMMLDHVPAAVPVVTST